jgi:hypothetical protein
MNHGGNSGVTHSVEGRFASTLVRDKRRACQAKKQSHILCHSRDLHVFQLPTKRRRLPNASPYPSSDT